MLVAQLIANKSFFLVIEEFIEKSLCLFFQK